MSAGDDALDQLRRGAKRRRTFAGIEDSEASARAGADVEQSPAAFKRAHDPFDCLFDFRSLRQNCRRDIFVLAQHQRNGFGDGQLVQIDGSWITLFRGRQFERFE